MSQGKRCFFNLTFSCDLEAPKFNRNHRLVFFEKSVQNLDELLQIFQKYYTNEILDIVYSIPSGQITHKNLAVNCDADVEALLASTDLYKYGARFTILMDGDSLEKVSSMHQSEELPVFQEELSD